jgi:lipoprotein-releasing system ATP-binding protein
MNESGGLRSVVSDQEKARIDDQPGAADSAVSVAADYTLQAVQLSKSYPTSPSEIRVLRELNLSVRAGEMVAIVGASGAGKSTLLHLLGGLDRPTSGRVLFHGFDISELSAVDLARFRSRVVGFMFQFHHLLPEFTALENVMMPLLIRGTRKLEAAERARSALSSVGLETRLKHRPAELSGGEQQRVALARALVTAPHLLLADEPTGNLDGRTGEKIFSLLQHLHQTNALTSLIATHNERLAARCDRVLHLEDGQLR